MHITKMHGLGNSQIIVEDHNQNLEEKTGLDYSQIAKSLCHPDFGVGSDQTLIILSSETADYRMRIFNKDGGEAEMCGNGIRCVAKYLFDKEKVGKKTTIETLGGTKKLEIIDNEDKTQVSVNMGKGKLIEKEKKVGDFVGSFISVGNPHFVIFTENASKELARKEGPSLEKAEEFQPDRANIEFAKIISPKEIETYVWERGAGLTLACGTGACATAFAAWREEAVDSEVSIHLLGGELKVKISEDGEIEMAGPAEYILSGEVINLTEIFSNLEDL